MTQANTNAATGAIGNRAIVLLGIAVGFLLVPSAASFAPELVNGVLLLILIGIILGNADRWLPYLSQFSGASTTALKR